MKYAIAIFVVLSSAISICGCSDDGVYTPAEIDEQDAGIDASHASPEK